MGHTSPPHSKRERNHSRWNTSPIGILIFCFCEESRPAYKRELESKAQIPADATTSVMLPGTRFAGTSVGKKKKPKNGSKISTGATVGWVN
jgi:hypothetical protein